MVEVVDPAGSAGAEEVVVRHGATLLDYGLVASVVAGAVAARWAMLGGSDKRGRPRAVQGRGAG